MSGSSYFYSGPLAGGSPIASARSGSASARGASASAGPLLPHMQPPSLTALHEQQVAQAQAQQAQIDSARGNKRPTKLAGLGDSGSSLPILPAASAPAPVAASSSLLEPLHPRTPQQPQHPYSHSYSQASLSSLHSPFPFPLPPPGTMLAPLALGASASMPVMVPYAPMPMPPPGFDPAAAAAALAVAHMRMQSHQAAAAAGGPLAASPVEPSLDSYSAQVQQRRYNLLIRSAPQHPYGQTHRTAGSNGSSGGGGGKVKAALVTPAGEPTPAALDAGRLIQLGRRRLHQTEAVGRGEAAAPAAARNQARLTKMFGAQSSYAKQQRRARAREEALQQQQQQQQQQQSSSDHPHPSRSSRLPLSLAMFASSASSKQQHPQQQKQVQKQVPEEKQSSPSSSSLSADVPVTVTEAGRRAKQVKKILAFLSPSAVAPSSSSYSSLAASASGASASAAPPSSETAPAAQHGFFSHMPEAPVVTAAHAEALVDEVGAAVGLGYLRRLHRQGKRFDSVQALVDAVVALHREQRGSANAPAAAAAAGGGGVAGSGEVSQGQGLGAHASEEDHERAIAAVSQSDRDRLVSYLTSGPSDADADVHSDADAEVKPSLGYYTATREDGSTASVRLPACCSLFGEAEYVAASPRDLSEMVVAAGGVERLFAVLVGLDARGRRFPSVEALHRAVALATLERAEGLRARKQLAEYFARGEDAWHRDAQRRRSKKKNDTTRRVAGGDGVGSDDERADPKDCSSKAGTSRPRRDAPAQLQAQAQAAASSPPTCKLFQHLSAYPDTSAGAIARLVDESQCGAGLLDILLALEGRGVRAESLEDLADLALEEHLSRTYSSSDAAAAGTGNVPVPVASRARRDAVARFLQGAHARLFATADASSPSSSDKARAGVAVSPRDASMLLSAASGCPKLAVSYLSLLGRGGYSFPGAVEAARAVAGEHARSRRELLRFLRSDACALFSSASPSPPASSQQGEEAEAQEAEDPWQLRMWHMERLLLGSQVGSAHEALEALQALSDAGARVGSFEDLIALVSGVVSASAATRAREQKELLQFLSNSSSAGGEVGGDDGGGESIATVAPPVALLPPAVAAALDRHAVQRMWDVAGDDAPVLVRHLAEAATEVESGADADAGADPPAAAAQSRKCLYPTLESLMGALRDVVASVPSQKEEVLAHLVSKQSALLERVAWDPVLTAGRGWIVPPPADAAAAAAFATAIAAAAAASASASASALRPNYFAVREHLLRRRSRASPHAQNSHGGDATATKSALELSQLIEEAAAFERRNRIAALTGQQQPHSKEDESAPAPSSPAAAAAAAGEQERRQTHTGSKGWSGRFGTELARSVGTWTAPSIVLPASLPVPASNGIVLLNSSAINALYRAGGAGPSTLSLLWQLETERKRFTCVADLAEAVRSLHTERAHRAQHERAALLAFLHGHESSSSPAQGAYTYPASRCLFSQRAAAVTPAEVAALMAVFGEGQLGLLLFHVQRLHKDRITGTGGSGGGLKYDSFSELLSAVTRSKAEFQRSQHEALSYLSSPLCLLLPPAASTTAPSLGHAALRKVCYDTGAGAQLPYLLALLDGRSGGTIEQDMEEQRRRARLVQAQVQRPGQGQEQEQAVQYKYSSLGELTQSIGKLHREMEGAHAEAMALLSSPAADTFFAEASASAAGDDDAEAAGKSSDNAPSQALVALASPSAPTGRKAWTGAEVTRLQVEGKGGLDVAAHLAQLVQAHGEYASATAAGATATQSPVRPPVFSSVDALVLHVQTQHRAVVSRRSADKTTLRAFLSQSNSIMSAAFHAARGVPAAGSTGGAVGGGGGVLALMPPASQSETALVASSSSASSSDSALIALLNAGGSDQADPCQAHKRQQCHWTDPEIDALYQAGQEPFGTSSSAPASSVAVAVSVGVDVCTASPGPATLVHLREIEQVCQGSGRRFHAAPELLDAVRLRREESLLRKREVYAYLTKFASRFWGAPRTVKGHAPAASVSSPSSGGGGLTSPRKKKFASAGGSKDMRVGAVVLSPRAVGAVAAAPPAATAAAHFAPTLADVVRLYEESGAGATTLALLQDMHLDPWGRPPFRSMDDLVAATKAGHLRRVRSHRAGMEELLAFFASAEPCPLFSAPTGPLSAATVHFLVGCAGGDAGVAVSLVHALLEESQHGGRGISGAGELAQQLRARWAALREHLGQVRAFLTSPSSPGRALLRPEGAGSSSQETGTGVLREDSLALRDMCVEGGAGTETLRFLRQMALERFAPAPSPSPSADGPSEGEGALAQLGREIARRRLEARGEQVATKERVFAFLRREPGSEVDGALCDLLDAHELARASSFHRVRAARAAVDAALEQQGFSGGDETEPASEDSTALVLAHGAVDAASAPSAPAPSVPVSSALTHADVHRLFHLAGAGAAAHVPAYLHELQASLRSFASVEELAAAVREHHERAERFKEQILAFFVEPHAHAHGHGHTHAHGHGHGHSSSSSAPHRLFEHSPYAVMVDSGSVDTILEQGGCGADTLGHLQAFAGRNHSFHTLNDLVLALRDLQEEKLAKLQPHKARVMEYLSSESCRLFRGGAVALSEQHLELLVEAGRAGVVHAPLTGQAGAEDASSAPAASRSSPSTAAIAALAYLDRQGHWFAAPKALVLAARAVLGGTTQARRQVFQFLNGAGSPEDVVCTLWDAASPAPSTGASPPSGTGTGRAGGKAKARSPSSHSPTPPVPLRFTSESLAELFERVGAGPETMRLLLSLQSAGQSFPDASSLIEAAVQAYQAVLARRRRVVELLQGGRCQVFSGMAPHDHARGLTLADAALLLESVEAHQLAEEKTWRVDQDRIVGGALEFECDKEEDSDEDEEEEEREEEDGRHSAHVVSAVSVSAPAPPCPLEPRALRLLRELSEVGTRAPDLAQLALALVRASWEALAREAQIREFLNDPERCQLFSDDGGVVRGLGLDLGAPQAPRKRWRGVHVRRLLQEVALFSSASSDQGPAQGSLPLSIPSPNPDASSHAYTGLGDVLLLLWSLNAAGRRLTSFEGLVQAVKDEMVLARECVAVAATTAASAAAAAATKREGAGSSQGDSDSTSTLSPLSAPLTYLLQTPLQHTSHAGAPRGVFGWDALELEYLHPRTSVLAPARLTALLGGLYKRWQPALRALHQFLRQHASELFHPALGGSGGASGGAGIDEVISRLHTEAGTLELWHRSLAGEHALGHLAQFLRAGRRFPSLGELLAALRKVHRTRVLDAKLQAHLDAFDAWYSRRDAGGSGGGGAGEQAQAQREKQRRTVRRALSAEWCTLFRPRGSGAHAPAAAGQGELELLSAASALPGQELLLAERDPHAHEEALAAAAAAVASPAAVAAVGGSSMSSSSAAAGAASEVQLTPAEIDALIYASGSSVTLLLMHLRQLSAHGRSFRDAPSLQRAVEQAQGEHIALAKQALRFFFRADCLLLHCSKHPPTSGAGASAPLMLLAPASSSAAGTDASSQSKPSQPLSRAAQAQDDHDGELASLGLGGLHGGGSSAGPDLSVADMSHLVRFATRGADPLPLLQGMDAAGSRYASFGSLLSAAGATHSESESALRTRSSRALYSAACRGYLGSRWGGAGLFSATIHSPVVAPSEQEFSALLRAASGSPSALLVTLHALNAAGRKFSCYSDGTEGGGGSLVEGVAEAQECAREQKELVWKWLRSQDCRLMAREEGAADAEEEEDEDADEDEDAPRAATAGGRGAAFPWSWSHVCRLYEETDAASDTLSHLHLLNTLGARFRSVDKLILAVTSEQQKLRLARAEATVLVRRKQGQALLRSYLLDPATHLFAVPVALQDHDFSDLYQAGERAETRIGIRVLGKLTRPGEAALHVLQQMERARPIVGDKFASIDALQDAMKGQEALRLIVERARASGIGPVFAPPPPPPVPEPEPLAPQEAEGAASASPATAAAPASAASSSSSSSSLSTADKQSLLGFLSSPQCGLFRELANSPTQQQLQIKTSDLVRMSTAVGGAGEALELLKRLDAAGRSFTSFAQLASAVEVEAMALARNVAAPPVQAPSLSPEQSAAIIAFLSTAPLLLDRANLAQKLSRADLDRLACGGPAGNVLPCLRDMSEPDGALVPASSWAQFVSRVAAHHSRLDASKREVGEYLSPGGEGSALFAAPLLFGPDLAPAALDALYASSGAGTATMGYLVSLVQGQQQRRLAGLDELAAALRSAHQAARSARATEAAKEKKQLLAFLSDSLHIHELFEQPQQDNDAASAAGPTISVTDGGLREMVRLTGSAAAAIEILNDMHQRGVRVASFQQLLAQFRQIVVDNDQ